MASILGTDGHSSLAGDSPRDHTIPTQLLKSQNGSEKWLLAFDGALLLSLHSNCTPVVLGRSESGTDS